MAEKSLAIVAVRVLPKGLEAKAEGWMDERVPNLW